MQTINNMLSTISGGINLVSNHPDMKKDVEPFLPSLRFLYKQAKDLNNTVPIEAMCLILSRVLKPHGMKVFMEGDRVDTALVPIFQHDCPDCLFLGLAKDSEGDLVDLYMHPRPEGGEITVRWGDHPEDNKSMPIEVLQHCAGRMSKEMGEAMKRAKDKGYI